MTSQAVLDHLVVFCANSSLSQKQEMDDTVYAKGVALQSLWSVPML